MEKQVVFPMIFTKKTHLSDWLILIPYSSIKGSLDFISCIQLILLWINWASISRLLRQNAANFLMDDIYRNPGPLQFEGPGSDAKTVTLCVEDQDYMGRIKELQEYLDKVPSLWSYFFYFYYLYSIYNRWNHA